MASGGFPIDSSQPKRERRNAALQLIQKLFGEARVKVLDPQAVLQNYKKPTAKATTAIHATQNGGHESNYSCVTEKFDTTSVASILVGLFTEIPRWKYGSVVKFAAYAGGYPDPEDAKFAAVCLWEAAEQWNSYDLGVTFEWVNNLEEAAFVLEYGGDKGTVLASAFFPNSQPLNTVFVYSLSLSNENHRATLKNTFLHELGHTLGLRHEFALDPERFEGGAEVYGKRNKKSVMSYTMPPQVQQSDIDDIRSFYKLRAEAPLPSSHGIPPNGNRERMTIKDYIPG